MVYITKVPSTLGHRLLVVDIPSRRRVYQQKVFANQKGYGINVMLRHTHPRQNMSGDLGSLGLMVRFVHSLARIMQESCPKQEVRLVYFSKETGTKAVRRFGLSISNRFERLDSAQAMFVHRMDMILIILDQIHYFLHLGDERHQEPGVEHFIQHVEIS